MKFKTKYNYEASKGLVSKLPSKTCSEFLEECDINSIMARYDSTGVLAGPFNDNSGNAPTFADVSNVKDYQSMMNDVIAAQDAFAALPARIRQRFANNPANLVDFVMDDSNYEEAVKLGLCKVKEIVTPEGSPVEDTASNASELT